MIQDKVLTQKLPPAGASGVLAVLNNETYLSKSKDRCSSETKHLMVLGPTGALTGLMYDTDLDGYLASGAVVQSPTSISKF